MMSQVDEGLIHAWLDGQLSGEEAERVSRLVATDPAWGSVAAEARGLIAGSSRVLSALDDVPRVRSATPTAVARRSFWGAPWLRVAASLVFVAGITGLVLREFSGNFVANDERAPVAAADAPAPTPAANVLPGDAGAQPPSAVREEKAATVAPPAAEARLEARASTRVAAAERDSLARDVRGKVADAGRGPVDTPVVAAQRVMLAPPPVPLVEQGVVGAVSLAAARLYERLAGCWVQLDSAGAPVSFVSPAPEMDAVARDVVGLRFIAPVATDLPLATRMGAGRGGGRGGRAGSEPSRSLAPQPRLMAMPMNATTRMLADSSYAAEFVDARGRAEMTFTAAGDTIRGTLRRSGADVRFPAVQFRAVRAECPR